MAGKEYSKTVVTERVNPDTGEVVFVDKITEIIGSVKVQSFIALRTSDGLGYLRGLKGNKFHIFTILAYEANLRDNTVNMSVAFADEISAFLGIGRRRIYELISEMEKDCYLVKLWGGKYMLNPDVYILGGSRAYVLNVKRFKDALKYRSTLISNKEKPNLKECIDILNKKHDEGETLSKEG